MSTAINEFFLEVIPESELMPHVPTVLYTFTDEQVTKVMHSSKALRTHKLRRVPRLEELQQLTDGLISIWQANDTFILKGESMGIFDEQVLCCDGYMIDLADDDKYLSFHSGSLECTVIGKSEHVIAETAAMLWRLDIDNEFSYIISSGHNFDFSVISLEQLGLLFKTAPTRDTILSASNISPVQSEFLAQLPYPISIQLFENSLESFSDDGHAFVEALFQRSSPFGSLGLGEIKDWQEGIFQRLLRAEPIDMLEMNSLWLSSWQLRQLLSASIKVINLEIDAQNLLGLDWSTVDVVPKELAVTFSCFNTVAHLDFVASFVRRVAELGDFVKLEIDLNIGGRIPDSLTKELIFAVEANQTLVELKLLRNFEPCGNHLEDLWAMMEHHKGLRRFTLSEYPKDMDPDYSMLKRLLNRNRFVDIMEAKGDLVTDGDEIDRLYAFNRFFRGLQQLTKEPLSLLPPIVAEVLGHSASGDFRRSALLMVNHTDALCELLQHSSHILASDHASA